MSSFVASSYARVKGDPSKVRGFPSWSEENITGTYYDYIYVPKGTKSMSKVYTDLINQEVQIIVYPVDYSTVGKDQHLFPTQHIAGFDSNTGTVNIARQDNEAIVLCDSVVILFSDGSFADPSGQYGIEITSSNNVSLIEKTYSNLILGEVISASNTSGDQYRGDTTSISYQDSHYKLYDLPIWYKTANDKIKVSFTDTYDLPPVVAVQCTEPWTLITIHKNTQGRYDAATFYLPNGLQAASKDLKIAVLAPLSTTFKRAVYTSTRYTSSYGSAIASHNVLHNVEEVEERPGVLVQTEHQKVLFNSRYIPTGHLKYAGDLYKNANTAARRSLTPVAINDPPSPLIPTTEGHTLNHVNESFIIASGYIPVSTVEQTKSWSKRYKVVRKKYYGSGGYVMEVTCLASHPTNRNIVYQYKTPYFSYAIRKTKKTWDFGVLVTALFPELGLLLAITTGSFSWTPVKSILNKIPNMGGSGKNYVNLEESGAPKVYTVNIRLPEMGVRNIVGYGTESKWVIPEKPSVGNVVIPAKGLPEYNESFEDDDFYDIDGINLLWIKYFMMFSGDRIETSRQNTINWCIANGYISSNSQTPVEDFDSLTLTTRKEIAYTLLSIYSGLDYIYYDDTGVHVKVRTSDVSSLSVKSTTFWGIVLKNHSGTKTLVRSLFSNHTDFLRYFNALAFTSTNDSGETVHNFVNFDNTTGRHIADTNSQVNNFWNDLYSSRYPGSSLSGIDSFTSNHRKSVIEELLYLAFTTSLTVPSEGVVTPTEWYIIHRNPETIYGFSDYPYFTYYLNDTNQPYTYCWEYSLDQQRKTPVPDQAIIFDEEETPYP